MDPGTTIQDEQRRRMFLFGLNPALTPMVNMQTNANLNDMIKNARIAETGYNYAQMGPSITGTASKVPQTIPVSIPTTVTLAVVTAIPISVPTPDSAIEELTKQMEQLSVNYANLYAAFNGQN